MKKSKVITFIGGFYIFGGIISFLSLLLGGSPLNTVFDLPDIPDYVVKFLLAIIYIPAGYLFLKRVKFSNWLILVLPPLETPTRKGDMLPLHGAHTAFSCYPALRLYRLSKSQRGNGVVSLSK